MKIAIATDSNSGISAREAEQLGVFLIPMPVIIDDQTLLEGVDIETVQLFDAMEGDKNVSSSQPAPGSVTQLWDGILAQGYDAIVYIPMTSGLSGSCQSAAMLAEDYDGKVFVVDNHRISVTQRASVLDAIRLADAGLTGAQIKEKLEAASFDASIYLTVADLKYLQRGGRLSSSAAVLGTLLNIKPMLTIQGYQVDVVAKLRGMKACEKKMIESLQQDIADRFGEIPREKLRVDAGGTLMTKEEQEQWRVEVQEAFPDMTVEYITLPCSISVHLGPGCRALAVSVEAN